MVDGRDDVKKQALFLGFFFKICGGGVIHSWGFLFFSFSSFFFLDFGAREYRRFISAICCRDFLLSAIKIFDYLVPK